MEGGRIQTDGRVYTETNRLTDKPTQLADRKNTKDTPTWGALYIIESRLNTQIRPHSCNEAANRVLVYPD